MQFAENGSLSQLLRQTKQPFDETKAKRLFAQMVSAVSHMHEIGIAHRDLKMGNILLDKNFNVFFTDFGLSRVSYRERRGGTVMSKQYTGTFPYMAPEILVIKTNKFGDHYYSPFTADVWALGVILYTLINRCYPFGDDKTKPQKMIENQLKFETSKAVVNRYSKPSHDLEIIIRRIFVFDSKHRIKITELMEQNWIKQEIKIINDKIIELKSRTFPPKED